MFDQVLRQIQHHVLAGNYTVTTHADEEMAHDLLTHVDLESAIMNGTIQERQRDRISGEWKYVIAGTSATSQPIEVVVKLDLNGVVVITVYVL